MHVCFMLNKRFLEKSAHKEAQYFHFFEFLKMLRERVKLKKIDNVLIIQKVNGIKVKIVI